MGVKYITGTMINLNIYECIISTNSSKPVKNYA